MTMRLFIGGVRGSRPVTGSACEEFGGETTSLLILGSRGTRLVLDAGTGMHAVAGELAAMTPGRVTVLFSHYHLDHMAGLTMCPLLYDAGWQFRLAGPALAGGGIEHAVTGILGPPYWPVRVQEMAATIEFAEFPPTDGQLEIQTTELRIRGCPVPHPGGCMAYRIDDASGGSLVFATDIEWRARNADEERAFMSLCTTPRSADLLLMDAHFGAAEAEDFKGWGHSCREDCLAIAESAGIGRVLLGHHAPAADDVFLRRMEEESRQRLPGAEMVRGGRWLTVE